MLILTRKPGESLYIGDHVKITIVEIKGNQIRVGIDAPQDMRIYREEIYLQILEENKKAAATSVSDESLAGLSQAWQGRSGGIKTGGLVSSQPQSGPQVRGLVASGSVPAKVGTLSSPQGRNTAAPFNTQGSNTPGNIPAAQVVATAESDPVQVMRKRRKFAKDNE